MNAAYLDMSIPYAAGGLYSTTHDLWRWERALFGGQVLSASSLRAMTTPFKNDYALGLAVHTVDGRTVIEHGGGINGFNTVLAYYPADTMTVVVLANLNGSAPDEIARDLAKVAHGETVVLPWERTEVPVSPAVLARYVGAYQLPHFEVTIALDSGRLSMQLGNQPPDPLYAESDTTFFKKDVDAQIAFIKNSQGEVTALVVHRGDGVVRAERKK